jgi:hypothetical protein
MILTVIKSTRVLESAKFVSRFNSITLLTTSVVHANTLSPVLSISSVRSASETGGGGGYEKSHEEYFNLYYL